MRWRVPDMLQSMLKYRDAAGEVAPAATDRLGSVSVSLKALAEPKRLALFELIAQGVQCNCDLGESLGMAPNLVSHHLGVLREAGLVQAERDPVDARWIYYSADPAALRELKRELSRLLDPKRIQPRRASCGPRCTPARSRSSREDVRVGG